MPEQNYKEIKYRKEKIDTMLSSDGSYKNYSGDWQSVDLTDPEENSLDFLLPQYGVQDFINERAIWQKGTHNLTGEPGWFYFKIFFNFHDTKGLFGGILDDIIPNTCAMRYLYGIRKFYSQEQIQDRMLALARFTHTLSYINSVCPWFFIGINGISKLNGIKMDDLSKEKSIEILCNGDAIDMRLNTLLDMYKYACYDEINLKEIIPQNLRKFDMSIVIMNVPIKYFQTGIITSGQNAKMNQIGNNGSTILNKAIKGINEVTSFISGSNTKSFDYKTVNGKANSEDNRLSFQMYTLKNCEIDLSSFENYTPSSMNNQGFFRMGTGSIKINYDRSYKHTFNEWNQMMYGSDGIKFDPNFIDNKWYKTGIDKSYKNQNNQSAVENQKNRIKAIQQSIYNSFFNENTEAYKALIDFSESVIQDSLINVDDPYYLGNIGDNYDQNSYEDIWNRTKNKVQNFFK